MKLVFATHNLGKLRELQAAFAPLDAHLIAQSTLGIESAPEDACTFIENALIKARHAALESGLPALADDSGLLVDALNGAPGVHSARFAGLQATDEENRAALLRALADTPAPRTARFCCVLVFIRHAHDPRPLISEGLWEGHILTEERGDQGFGYDPLFGLGDGRSAAQLSLGEKQALSHRGQAVRGMLQLLARRDD
ncbi:MAG: RdgB/HAM1 family non-canonical purine NTP pyrophosphatase [Gammaproteobacteria bacterium]|nr:RdgB/HAM1 family non-canonical purine NTP pyrophosphatase [Gammaproteobacteria bacterium]